MDVELSLLSTGQALPALVEPQNGAALEVWAEAHRDWLRDALREHGALLFRGFEIADEQRFAAFLKSAGFPLMDYPRGTSPRHAVGDRIYNSTDTRPDVAIPVHTEMSYTSVFPQAVALCCAIAPGVRGATPLADMRRVLARLPAELVSEFERRQLRYQQIVPFEATPALPKSWPNMFATTERSEVEQICAAQGIEAVWLDDGSLRIRGANPAVRPHPATGEPVWFNQGDIFHLGVFDYLRKEGAADATDEEKLYRDSPASDLEPYWCTFADGTEIDDALFEPVRRAIDAETLRFPWQRGDLLLVDNFRVAHGRESFEGPRHILAALVECL